MRTRAGRFFSAYLQAIGGGRIRLGSGVVENWVTFGASARVYDTDFHPLCHFDRRIHRIDAIGAAKVRICEDAFIGAGATILKGVTVEAPTIAGVGAILTRDVPPDSVVAGVPAPIVGASG